VFGLGDVDKDVHVAIKVAGDDDVSGLRLVRIAGHHANAALPVIGVGARYDRLVAVETSSSNGGGSRWQRLVKWSRKVMGLPGQLRTMLSQGRVRLDGR